MGDFIARFISMSQGVLQKVKNGNEIQICLANSNLSRILSIVVG